MIGSPSNKALLREAGLLAAEGEQAGANDLVIALRAVRRAPWAGSASFRTRCPERRQSVGDAASRPQPGHARSTRCRSANLALISVPGEFAVAEARKALHAGLHALVFSSGVPLEEERALKLSRGRRACS